MWRAPSWVQASGGPGWDDHAEEDEQKERRAAESIDHSWKPLQSTPTNRRDACMKLMSNLAWTGNQTRSCTERRSHLKLFRTKRACYFDSRLNAVLCDFLGRTWISKPEITNTLATQAAHGLRQLTVASNAMPEIPTEDTLTWRVCRAE